MAGSWFFFFLSHPPITIVEECDCNRVVLFNGVIKFLNHFLRENALEKWQYKSLFIHPEKSRGFTIKAPATHKPLIERGLGKGEFCI